MIRHKVHNIAIKYSNFQYQFYWTSGVIKQLRKLLAPRNIAYNGEQPFLFIVGSGRSGNTLLRKLLMERGDIYIPPESYVLAQEVITHLNACALNWNDKVELTLAKFEFHPEFSTFGIDTLRDFSIYAKTFRIEHQQIGTLIIELYKWIAHKNGYSCYWLGDKTPLNTMRLGLIRKLIPNAVYVYIERDGVDVCHSYIKAGIYNNIASAAHRWKNSRIAWQTFKKSIPLSSYVEIRYESMVENHEQSTKYILDFLNIPASKDKINVVSTLGDVTMRAHHRNATTPVNMNSIGKGRASISMHERSILQSIIGDELEIAGYEPL